MHQRLDKLSRYQESQQFKTDAIAHVAANSWEATEVLCSNESARSKVIQGFFNSSAANRLLSEALSWAMSVGVTQMQH